MPPSCDLAADLAETIRVGTRAEADPDYVAGTVAARSPGKPVLGVRIPLLRAAVRRALRAACPRGSTPDGEMVRQAAGLLWNGEAHEDELAACMLLRLATVAPTGPMVRQWAPLLDNWLSVDELGGAVGEALQAGSVAVDDLLFLARATSPWQRRLYLVCLITPIRLGLDPGDVPMLDQVLPDDTKPVRKAATWLITSVLKVRPDAADQFRAVLAGTGPRPLIRLLPVALPS